MSSSTTEIAKQKILAEANELFKSASKRAGELLNQEQGKGLNDEEKEELRTVIRKLEQVRELYNKIGHEQGADQCTLPITLCQRALGNTAASDKLFQAMAQTIFPRSSGATGDAREDLTRKLNEAKFEAVQHLRNGELEQAYRTLSAAEQLLDAEIKKGTVDPTSYGLSLVLGPFYEQIGTLRAQMAERSGFPKAEVEKAASYFQKGLDVVFSSETKQRMLLFLAETYDRASLWTQAIEVYKSLERQGIDTKNHEIQWHAVDRIGAAQAAAGQFKEALATHLKAMELTRHFSKADKGAHAKIRSMTSVAALHDQLESPSEAFPLLYEALRLSREHGGYDAQYTVLQQLGKIQVSRGLTKEALANLQLAAAIAPNIYKKTTALAYLGEAHDELGDLDKALGALDEALKICVSQDFQDLKRVVLTNLGKVYNRKGQPQKALEYLQESVRINEQLRDRVGLMKTFSLMVSSLRGLGREKEAREYIKKVVDLDRSLSQQA